MESVFSFITWNIDPVLFRLGSLEIRYYGLLWALSFYIGYEIGKKMFKNENESEKSLDPLLFSVILGGVLGARLGHVFFYDWAYYSQHLAEILLPFRFGDDGFEFTGFAGLASHGGAIGIVLSLIYYKTKKSTRSYLWILDKVALPTALAAFFIRMANFMNSEIVGDPTGTDFGIVFTQLGEDFPRHPAQLYEAISYIIIFGIMWFLYWKKKKYMQEGFLFGFFLVTLFTARFFVEFVKNHQGGLEELSVVNNALSTGQILSIPFVLIGVYLLWNSSKTKISQ